MNKKMLGVLIALIIVVIGGFFFSKKTGEVSPEGTLNTEASSSTTASTETKPTDAVKAFTVTGNNFKFDTTEIKVKEGDTVRITFINSEGTHDWKIDEFSAGTKTLKANQQETIAFVANKKGTFEYYCSIGSHRAMGMKGNLIVE